jgi:hypothetical protein
MLFVNVYLLCACALQGENNLPRHRKVRLVVKIGKFSTFDNIFFGGIASVQQSENESVTVEHRFLSHSDAPNGPSWGTPRASISGSSLE